MLTAIKHRTDLVMNSFPSRGCSQMSYQRAILFKGKLKKMLSNDGTGKHTHVVRETCTLSDCKQKKCDTLCDNEDEITVLGHNTHKPPIGRLARFIAETDANGDAKAQYFVKTNKKVTISAKEKKEASKDIVPAEKQDAFIKKHNDKYDD